MKVFWAYELIHTFTQTKTAERFPETECNSQNTEILSLKVIIDWI